MKRAQQSLAGRFNGILPARDDYENIEGKLRTRPLFYDVDLSTARAAGVGLTVNVAGNVLYCDMRTNSGIATVHFTDTEGSSTPITLFAGMICRIPFHSLTIENTAQPGAMLRLIYGVDLDFVPVPTGTQQIFNTVAVAEQGSVYGAAYKSTTALAGNTPETVFTPASNPNGAVVWSAQFFCDTAAGVTAGYLVKAVAPANITDGDLIVGVDSWFQNAGATVNFFCGKTERPLRVAAGKGLYFLSTGAESFALRKVLYTLL